MNNSRVEYFSIRGHLDDHIGQSLPSGWTTRIWSSSVHHWSFSLSSPEYIFSLGQQFSTRMTIFHSDDSFLLAFTRNKYHLNCPTNVLAGLYVTWIPWTKCHPDGNFSLGDQSFTQMEPFHSDGNITLGWNYFTRIAIFHSDDSFPLGFTRNKLHSDCQTNVLVGRYVTRTPRLKFHSDFMHLDFLTEVSLGRKTFHSAIELSLSRQLSTYIAIFSLGW
jgi:hypothetical protein